jgi:hypothetical protein
MDLGAFLHGVNYGFGRIKVVDGEERYFYWRDAFLRPFMPCLNEEPPWVIAVWALVSTIVMVYVAILEDFERDTVPDVDGDGSAGHSLYGRHGPYGLEL